MVDAEMTSGGGGGEGGDGGGAWKKLCNGSSVFSTRTASASEEVVGHVEAVRDGESSFPPLTLPMSPLESPLSAYVSQSKRDKTLEDFFTASML